MTNVNVPKDFELPDTVKDCPLPGGVSRIIDGHAVKDPFDYQEPEQLYQVLVERVMKDRKSVV